MQVYVPRRTSATRPDKLGRVQEEEGDELRFFEGLYTLAKGNADAIPWASLAAHPALVQWLDEEPTVLPGQRALVVGCGLGDDAEELARRGYAVTAFDLSPTAIDWCHQRFPHSGVNYEVADLFGLPAEWAGAFDLVVEIKTLQSLPRSSRDGAAAALAAMLRPGGRLFVHCLAGRDYERADTRPWPVSRAELRALVDCGLVEIELREDHLGRSGELCFRAIYQRPANGGQS
jgi:2-polyprenyl-3-methyl-5-hydroxy-6-metoxy-1,4-benzoquinol methylase